MFRKFKYVIIGAGPTGLGAAYRLKELGVTDFIVMEKLDRPGGLSASFVDSNGFTWDIGGHIQFSHYTYFDQMMEKALGSNEWISHMRESWAWMKEGFVPYPVQNNIRYLPKDIMWKCLSGIIDAERNQKRISTEANFRDWIFATFGVGLAEEFMIPYNFKVWAYPAERLSYEWIGERVSVTDLKRITHNVLFEKDDLSWGPNNRFNFPRNGGTGAIWTSVKNLVGEQHFMWKSEVIRMDPLDRVIYLNSGEEIGYENVLSTMPLDMLCTRIQRGAERSIVELSQDLMHSSSNIVGIGLKGRPGPHLQKKCWMYFPEGNCPFYRATVFSNYSPFNVPNPSNTWSLMAEVSESPEKSVNRSNLVHDTIQGLMNCKLIQSEDDVVSTWTYHADYGYPTPTLGRNSIIGTVLPELEKYRIYSRGRFGAWKYEVSNQDHSAMQGVEWANYMVHQIPETTLRYPGTANANWGKLSLAFS